MEEKEKKEVKEKKEAKEEEKEEEEVEEKEEDELLPEAYCDKLPAHFHSCSVSVGMNYSPIILLFFTV